jgi:hypothetical protein
LERELESACQRIDRWRARCVCDTDPEVANASGPIVLVVHLGDDDLGRAGQGRGGRGARAAVMDDGGDACEEDVLIHLADGQAVGLVVHEGEVGPPARQNRAASHRAR